MFKFLNFSNKIDLLPIPKHLKSIFLPVGKSIDDYEVTGKIICECGNENFKIKIVGDDSKYQIDRIIQTLEIEDNFYLVVKIECNKCKKEHLIFDNVIHGYDGFVGGMYDKEIIRPLPKDWCCNKCQNTNHFITMFFQSEGKEDFLSLGDEFDADDWGQAFGWIIIKIQCKNCGEINNEWVSLETA